MIGRDVANLAYLAPGVKAADSYDPTKNRYAILSVNGQGGRNVNVTVNGVDNKDNTVGGPVMQLPLEAVQEFQITTQRFSAENGRSEGAAINMITKQGTNQFHGSLFSYFRDFCSKHSTKRIPTEPAVTPPESRLQPPVLRWLHRRSDYKRQALRFLRYRAPARKPEPRGNRNFFQRTHHGRTTLASPLNLLPSFLGLSTRLAITAD